MKHRHLSRFDRYISSVKGRTLAVPRTFPLVAKGVLMMMMMNDVFIKHPGLPHE